MKEEMEMHEQKNKSNAPFIIAASDTAGYF